LRGEVWERKQVAEQKYKKQFDRDEWGEDGICKCGHPAYDLEHHNYNQRKRIAFVRASRLTAVKLGIRNPTGKNVGNVAPDLRGEARKVWRNGRRESFRALRLAAMWSGLTLTSCEEKNGNQITFRGC
jgi:hypothetical protein